MIFSSPSLCHSREISFLPINQRDMAGSSLFGEFSIGLSDLRLNSAAKSCEVFWTGVG